ncbi:CvpA family protein [Crocinitomicaceae bacterium CZZ-1]|uniref:CvpA family protein n=1 Tax=Taishania pollutisoli TaxID=2766479 RepID=A0A8J6PMG1_9FLAO|nr:CvpA family protein [Taishania pollutisoli]MBC9813545.1 CvpA family protein [Taishania pollutisoli]MBX2949053.1 CvpA family protein [Crocinitomicaceae bacterium]NGF76017.1 CvpA family protein [Fluviicola sp. SGL-29]
MNFIDILLLIPIGYAVYKGFKNGFIIEVCTLLALLVGIYAGIHFSDGTANLLKTSWNIHSEYLPVIAFTITFLGVGALVFFGGKMLEKVVDVANLTPLNKFLGILFALIKIFYLLSVFIVLLESYDEKGDFIKEETKQDSLLYEPVKNLSLTTIPRIKESTIFLTNSLKAEQDSTGLSVQDILRAKEIADSLGIDANDAMELKRIHDEYSQKETTN